MASIPANSQVSSFLKTLRALKGKPYERGFSLPGAFYTDSLWTQTECSELFARDWFCVGRVEEVSQPGDFFAFDQIGEPLLVVHGRDGVIRVLSNVCRHRGTVIVEGSGNTKKFLCPYHQWAYDTAGQLLNAPHLDSHEAFNLQECRLPELKCEFWQGFNLANLNPRAASISKQLVALDEVIKNYHLDHVTALPGRRNLGYKLEVPAGKFHGGLSPDAVASRYPAQGEPESPVFPPGSGQAAFWL